MLLRSALRSLRRSPGLTVAALVSLALGLGANIGLFTMLNAVLLRPLPFPEVDRLRDVHEHHPTDLCAGCGVGTSFPTFQDWKAATSFERLEAYLEQPFSLATTSAPAERVSGAIVSAGLLDALGLPPIHGRTFSAADDQPGAPKVVILSEQLWTGRFGADPAVVGTTVRLNGMPHTVVGVMPARLGFPEFARLWTPIAGQLSNQARDDRSLGVVGRLRAGVSIAAADAEVARLNQNIASEHPDTHRGWIALTAPLDRPLADAGANVGFALALAAAGLVLLVACANLANLLLARGAARSRETAIHAALGAGRRHIVTVHLVEALMLAATGAALGLVVAGWILQGVIAAIGSTIPVWIDLGFDWRVYGFASALAAATSVLFGLVPALEATRTDVQQTLKAGSTITVGRREARLRDGLAIAQMSLAVVLLTGMALMVKSFLVATRSDAIGHDRRGILQASAQLLEPRYEDSTAVENFGQAVLDRLAATAGVSAAALSHQEFLGVFVGNGSRVFLDGDAEPLPRDRAPRFGQAVTPGYFAVERITVRRGRGISPTDRLGTDLVAVINQVTADRMWPGEEAVGKRFRIGDRSSSRTYTVVGVVNNVDNTLSNSPPAMVYTAFAQAPARPITIQIRTSTEPSGFADALTGAVRAVDPDQPLENLMTGEEVLAVRIAPLRFMMATMGSLGLLALLLAAFGLYSVLAYLVARRTRELGIRMALGAARAQLLGLVIGRGLRLVVIAVVLAGPIAWGSTRLLRSVLFTVSPLDPAAFALAPVGLALVAGLACYLPARRATQVNPVDALRAE